MKNEKRLGKIKNKKNGKQTILKCQNLFNHSYWNENVVTPTPQKNTPLNILMGLEYPLCR